MFAKQSNAIRFVTSVMAFVLMMALLPASLPAHRTSAQSFEQYYSKKQVNQAVWRAAAKKARIKHAQKAGKVDLDRVDTAFVLVASEVLYGTSQPGSARYETVDRLFKEYNAVVQRDNNGIIRSPRIKTVDDLTYAFFDVATQYPTLKDEVLQSWLRLSNEQNYLKHKAQSVVLAPSLRRYGLERIIVNQHDAEIGRMFEEGQVSERMSRMMKDIYGKDAPPILRFEAQAYMSANQDEPVSKILLSKIQPDGSVKLSLADIKALTEAEFDNINASIDDLRDTLVDINEKQGVLLDYMADQQARERAQAAAAAKAQAHQLKLQASASGIELLSTLVGFKDAKLGRQISTVGNSALQIGESLNGWMEAVAGLSTFDKVTSLSTVVATGNIVGAVMNVYSLFGDSEPNPDQMILEEIGKLREQVSELRTEMHDRFDRVDAQLNTIYTTMNDRFDMIDVQLGRINGNLQEIQQTLATLENTLARIEHNNFEFMDAANRRPLLNQMNSVLGYQQRTGQRLPYEPQFVDAESLFYTWATEHAYDALSAGPLQRDYSDGAVLAELSAYPLDVNLNYLNGWLKSKNFPTFADERLPGPRDWLFANRAYTTLGMESPAFLDRINTNDPQRKQNFDAVGGELETALRRISTQTVISGTAVVTVGNTSIFSSVLGYYNDKLIRFERVISATEAGYVRDLPGKVLGRSTPMDLFGGMDQPLAHVPDEFINMTCGGAYVQPLATPVNLKSIVPNFNRYNLANYLGLQAGEIKVCLTGEVIDTAVDNCRPDPSDPRLEICDDVEKYKMTVKVYAEDAGIGQIAVESAHFYKPFDIPNGTATDQVIAWWAFLKPEFDAQLQNRLAAQASSLTAMQATPQQAAATTQFAELSSAVESQMGTLQQGLYGYLQTLIRNGTNAEVRQAALELAGAKKLLDSFMTLGAADAVGADDFLHSLVFGDQRVPDPEQIAATYDISATQPITAAHLMSNVRLMMEQTGLKRQMALDERIGFFLNAITADTHTESVSFIASARHDLQLAVAFAKPIAEMPNPPLPPIPPGGMRVFVPLIMR